MFKILNLAIALLGVAVSTLQAAPTDGSAETPMDAMCRAHPVSAIEQRAKDGDPDAQFHLATFLLHGFCVPQEVETAITWFQQAAVGRHAEAAFSLGQMHLKGTLVELDLEAAEGFLRIAADQNHQMAQHRLGLTLLWRAATAEQRHEALYWLGAAADQGHGFSAVSIGMLHQKGMHGVTEDKCVALDWYESAILMGFDDKAGLYRKLRDRQKALCY
ncbi:MAG: tetratricopeptide repeat protein [Pseudomonadota bacterium]